MAIRTNHGPRVMVGPLASRPAAPGVNGLIYASPTDIAVYDLAATTWRSAGGGSIELKYLVGPVGSGAPYTLFADAIAAAVADGANTVTFLAGEYTEDFSLPKDISLMPVGADFGCATLNGTITLTAASGRQQISGLFINGRIFSDTASTAVVVITDTYVIPPALPASPNAALFCNKSGWVFMVDNCTFDGRTAAVKAVAFDGASTKTTLSAFNSSFAADDATNAITLSHGGSVALTQCLVQGKPIKINADFDATIQSRDTFYSFPTGETVMFDGQATTTLLITGWIQTQGLDETACVLLSGSGVALVTSGVYIGNFAKANLPANVSDGCTAYCADLAGSAAMVYHGNGFWRRFSDNTPVS